jgi:hypothetical protein
MNDGVLVVVHAYGGDVDRTRDMLGMVLHHERPVLLLSPEDSPAVIHHPQVTCRQGGLREWQGTKAALRQIEHFRIALGHDDSEWFLMNDADSFVIQARIPDYMFKEEDVVWGTPIGFTGNWRGAAGGDHPWPNLQPPYFMHRRWLEEALRWIDTPSRGGPIPISCTGPEGRIYYDKIRWVGDDTWSWADAQASDGVYNMLLMRCGMVARANPLGATTMGGKDLGEAVKNGARFLHPVKLPIEMAALLAIRDGVDTATIRMYT